MVYLFEVFLVGVVVVCIMGEIEEGVFFFGDGFVFGWEVDGKVVDVRGWMD